MSSRWTTLSVWLVLLLGLAPLHAGAQLALQDSAGSRADSEAPRRDSFAGRPTEIALTALDEANEDHNEQSVGTVSAAGPRLLRRSTAKLSAQDPWLSRAPLTLRSRGPPVAPIV